MKTTKKILSVLLAVIMVLSIVPIAGMSSFAVKYGDYEFDILSETDKTCRISDYTGSAADLTIPFEIDGYTVTEIGFSAFYWCTSLISVTIPDSVTSIDGYAFYNCTSLTSVTIPNSVTSIDYRSFSSCTSLTSINIPGSVTSIDNGAFDDCDSLTSINVEESNMNYSSIDGVLFNKDKTELIMYPQGNTNTSYIIPNSVTSISWSAFENCTLFTSVTIPDSVASIGGYAFWNCTSLTSITIPDSLSEICNDAFYNTAYYNNESNWENGVLYIGNHLIEAKYDISESYEIKDGTKTVADSAFHYCPSLTSITIPNSVTSIGAGAFGECTSLTSVTIPASVTSIGEVAFGYYLDTGYDYKKIDGFTISSYSGSAAEKYANDNGFTFVSLGAVTADYTEYDKAVEKAKAVDRSVYTDESLAVLDTAVAVDVSGKDITEQSVVDAQTKAITDAVNALVYKDADYTEYNKAIEQAKAVDRSVYTNESLAVLDSALAVDVSGKNMTEQSVVDAQTKAILDAVGGLKIKTVSMYRLYNPNSGEHFYTADVSEKDNLVYVGWKYEGIGWTAPITSDEPVYRLYNQNGGEHHYTLDAGERDFLVNVGWKYEGIGWYSDEAEGVPIYRQYNPNAFANNHNYTADKSENDWLVGLGWKAEGIGWYGVE